MSNIKPLKYFKHPKQPTYFDVDGIRRFKSNKIVEFLLDNSRYTLNDIALMKFSNEDRRQFAQLIGYSVCGYYDLSIPLTEEE